MRPQDDAAVIAERRKKLAPITHYIPDGLLPFKRNDPYVQKKTSRDEGSSLR